MREKKELNAWNINWYNGKHTEFGVRYSCSILLLNWLWSRQVTHICLQISASIFFFPVGYFLISPNVPKQIKSFHCRLSLVPILYLQSIFYLLKGYISVFICICLICSSYLDYSSYEYGVSLFNSLLPVLPFKHSAGYMIGSQ